MNLEKIKGNTYYINAPTNIGVYSFKNKNCILVDTGINSTQARKINSVLLENKLHPKFIINTHGHLDHCGGNNFFTEEYPGCLVYTSQKEKVYMENIELDSIMIYSSIPSREIEKFRKSFKVDFTLEYGINKINDEKFEILPLKGHSAEQIGIVTPEKVCFLGDSIFSKEIMEKYGIPYLLHIGDSENSLNYMKEIDADYFVISHSDGVIERKGFLELIELNLQNVDKFKHMILELLEQPLTREDILENICVLNDYRLSFKQYHLYIASITAFLTNLFDAGLIEYSIENGRLYYFKKS
jgi:glyoxylase-like metal-dependent hydrolase (beta-lactamase superfamily II)